MNKALLVAIPVVLLLGIGGYLMFSNQDSLDGSDNGSVDTTMANEEKKFDGTFSDLLKLGQNYTCTFDNTDEAGNRTEGIVYIASSGDRLRGDFTFSEGNGTSYYGGVIRDGEYNYVWTDDHGGFKTRITEADTNIFASGESTTSTGLSDDTDVDFDCKRWIVDASMFAPPVDIEFADIGAMMEEINDQTSEQLEGIDCSVCDSAPAGATRDQCLAALGC